MNLLRSSPGENTTSGLPIPDTTNPASLMQGAPTMPDTLPQSQAHVTTGVSAAGSEHVAISSATQPPARAHAGERLQQLQQNNFCKSHAGTDSPQSMPSCGPSAPPALPRMSKLASIRSVRSAASLRSLPKPQSKLLMLLMLLLLLLLEVILVTL